MAIGFNAAGDYARRTTNLPSVPSLTICGWAKITGIIAATWQYFAGIEDAVGSASNYVLLGFNNAGAFELAYNGGSLAFGTVPTVGQWFFWAFTCAPPAGANLNGYYAHAGNPLENVFVNGYAGLAPAAMYIGNDSWSEYCNVHMAHERVWDSVLTPAELAAEMASETFVKAGPRTVWPMANNADNLDISGNGYHLTLAGTLTTETGPFAGGGPAGLKSAMGLAKANVKTIDGLAIASVKTWQGLT